LKDSLQRREILAAAGAATLVGMLDGCQGVGPREAGGRLQLPLLQADISRVTAITVCTRPFRPEGPRLDVEHRADKTIVHNYGHGGSGWSLSWGSSAIAAENALATGERDIAVIGCGALGLTSALSLQRAGARVTIYARDLPPNVRSSLATGIWSPDSRICLAQHATAEFKQRWERMARKSWQTYQSLLGLPGEPVEFFDQYAMFDSTGPASRRPQPPDRPRFADLADELLPDLQPTPKQYAPGSHPFGKRTVQVAPTLMFNLSAYTRLLMSDFTANGGRIEIVEFHSESDLVTVRQKTLVNATGYGARGLFGDESVVPVRGQLAHLIPQPDVRYGIYYKRVSVVPRRDGTVFQLLGPDDYYGYGDDKVQPDRAEAALAVNTIAGLFA
jgi:glycine/D-amino acid oxidase-like deaminating enzyme